MAIRAPKIAKGTAKITLKGRVQLSYWANPASWEPLGYDGPMTKRLGLKSLGNAPLPTR